MTGHSTARAGHEVQPSPQPLLLQAFLQVSLLLRLLHGIVCPAAASDSCWYGKGRALNSRRGAAAGGGAPAHAGPITGG